LEEVRVGLGLPLGQPFSVSSVTGLGIKQLWGIIMDACEDKIDELREAVETGGESKVSEDDAEAFGNVQLDEDGNYLDDEAVAEGYEWIQSFAYHHEAFFSCWWSFFYHLGEKGGGKEEGCICMP
jgi:hypothetical protein